MIGVPLSLPGVAHDRLFLGLRLLLGLCLAFFWASSTSSPSFPPHQHRTGVTGLARRGKARAASAAWRNPRTDIRAITRRASSEHAPAPRSSVVIISAASAARESAARSGPGAGDRPLAGARPRTGRPREARRAPAGPSSDLPLSPGVQVSLSDNAALSDPPLPRPPARPFGVYITEGYVRAGAGSTPSPELRAARGTGHGGTAHQRGRVRPRPCASISKSGRKNLPRAARVQKKFAWDAPRQTFLAWERLQAENVSHLSASRRGRPRRRSS